MTEHQLDTVDNWSNRQGSHRLSSEMADELGSSIKSMCDLLVSLNLSVKGLRIKVEELETRVAALEPEKQD